MRREKKKLMKRKLKSADTVGSLMLELPFALTSPTTWKELGCMYIIFYYINDSLNYEL